jgi:O-antigen/teichoic acid export membrane protein
VWIGEEFSRHSALPLQIMALGVLLNTVGIVVQSAIYASGRSREVALLQLTELPLYFIAQCLLVYSFGLTGAACAWTVRIAFDSVIMWRIARVKCFTPLPNGKGIVFCFCSYFSICLLALVTDLSLVYKVTILLCLAIVVAPVVLWMIWNEESPFQKKRECLV